MTLREHFPLYQVTRGKWIPPEGWAGRLGDTHRVRALGTWPGNAGSTGVMPKARMRSRMRCWEGQFVSTSLAESPSTSSPHASSLPLSYL